MQKHEDFDWEIINGIKSLKERIKNEREGRLNNLNKNLTFGIPFLDDCLNGIYPNDLVLLGAKTGAGKTQLATIVAMQNAVLRKNVVFFALEAEPNEIERRIKFQFLANIFYTNKLYTKYPDLILDYQKWYYGELDDQLKHLEPELDDLLANEYGNLRTFYKTSEFSIEDLEREIMKVKDTTDLFIVDHIHFMDIQDENENRGMKRTMMRIRDLVLHAGKPILLIAHFRKSLRGSPSIVPNVDEFHGSSDLSKISTKIITVARSPENFSAEGERSTLIRVVKNRVSGDRCEKIGGLSYSFKTQRYHTTYKLAELNYTETELKWINDRGEAPFWAKHFSLA